MSPGLTFLIIISIELVTLFELVIRYPEIVERQLRNVGAARKAAGEGVAASNSTQVVSEIAPHSEAL